MSSAVCNHSYSFNHFMSHDPSIHNFSMYRQSLFHKHLKKAADEFVGGNFPLVLCDKIAEFARIKISESNCTLCQFNKKISKIMLMKWHYYYVNLNEIYSNLIRNHGKGKDGNQDEVFVKCLYLHVLNTKYLKKLTYVMPSFELDLMRSKQFVLTEVFSVQLIHYLKSCSYNNMKALNVKRVYDDQFYFKLGKDLIKKIDYLLSELKNINDVNKQDYIKEIIKKPLFKEKKLLEEILKNQDYIRFEK